MAQPGNINFDYLKLFGPGHFSWLYQTPPALPSLFAKGAQNNPAGLIIPPMPTMNGGGIYNAPRTPYGPGGAGGGGSGAGGNDFGDPRLPPGVVKPPIGSPPGSTGGYGQPGSTNRGGVLPQNPNATAVTQPNSPSRGGVYRPNPVGNPNRGAYRPIRFPGVEANGGNWSKYQDGSFVDYSSGAWKRAAGIQIADAQQKQIWDAIPDSWKADMAGWDPAIRDAWLAAMKNPNVGGIFQGEWMTGLQAAEKIAKMAHDAANQAASQEKQAKANQKKIDEANRAIRPTPNYVPSPYI